MRFEPVIDFASDNGLDIAQRHLLPIKKAYPGISYADLWQYAGAVSIVAMGGPKTLKWRPGRADAFDAISPANRGPIVDGLLPDAKSDADGMRVIFYRMGFSDQEIVALMGGVSLISKYSNIQLTVSVSLIHTSLDTVGLGFHR